MLSKIFGRTISARVRPVAVWAKRVALGVTEKHGWLVALEAGTVVRGVHAGL